MYSTACHRQKPMTKPQQAAQNQPKAAKKYHKHLNYHTWELTGGKKLIKYEIQ